MCADIIASPLPLAAKLKDNGAIWEYKPNGPHVQYVMADKHSPFYFNTDIAVSDTETLIEMCDYFAGVIQDISSADWVVSYFTPSVAAGVALAAALANRTGAKLGYLNLDNGAMPFPVSAGDRVIVAVDDIHSGSSTRSLISTLKNHGAIVQSHIITLGNFSGRSEIENHTIASIVQGQPQTWSSSECPLCKAGSKALNPRKYWQELNQAI